MIVASLTAAAVATAKLVTVGKILLAAAPVVMSIHRYREEKKRK